MSTAGNAPGGLHADARRVLRGWRPPDPAQERLRERFLAHLDAHADGVFRDCRPGHITASTAVLDHSRSQVLLTLHRKLKAWLQLGGHCEPGDGSLARAALREATEESGIPGLRLSAGPVQIDRHSLRCAPPGAGPGPDGTTWHLDVQYMAVAPPGARLRISDESDDLCWFPVEALPEPTDDVVRRLVRRAVHHA